MSTISSFNWVVIFITLSASILNAAFLVPQFIKMLRTKSVASLSVISSVVAVLSALCWIVYLTIDGIEIATELSAKIIILIASIADWGMFIVGTCVLVYQVWWIKNNVHEYRARLIVSKLTNEKLIETIELLKKHKNDNNDPIIQEMVEVVNDVDAN